MTVQLVRMTRNVPWMRQGEIGEAHPIEGGWVRLVAARGGDYRAGLLGKNTLWDFAELVVCPAETDDLLVIRPKTWGGAQLLGLERSFHCDTCAGVCLSDDEYMHVNARGGGVKREGGCCAGV